jgi:hypothetical protein
MKVLRKKIVSRNVKWLPQWINWIQLGIVLEGVEDFLQSLWIDVFGLLQKKRRYNPMVGKEFIRNHHKFTNN